MVLMDFLFSKTRIVLIIGLGLNRQPTFVDKGGPIQVSQAGPCRLGRVRTIYLFINTLFILTKSSVFYKLVCLFTKCFVFS